VTTVRIQLQPMNGLGAIVLKHELSGILAGGDLQATVEGGIAVTADGDFKFGNDKCNAMHRLVQRWRSNGRVLETLLDLVAVDLLRQENAKDDREAIASAVFIHRQLIGKSHALTAEIETGEFGFAACAGAVMVVLSNLLLGYKTDLNATNPKWECIDPQFGVYSFGEVVVAAANNFRHHDEWARTRKLNAKQRKSIAVIEGVLNYDAGSFARPAPWRRNACAALLLTVDGRKLETLERNFFDFAKAMLT
jgi:hypothetical protein